MPEDDRDDWTIPETQPRTTTGQFTARLAGYAFKDDDLTIKLVVTGDEAALVAANLPRLTGLLAVVMNGESRQLAFWD